MPVGFNLNKFLKNKIKLISKLVIIVMPYYAVHKGKKPGIYKTWSDTKENVIGFPGAKFMKFDNEEDAALFLASGIKPSKKKAQQKEISEYFQTDLKGLERYGIITKKRPTEIKENDPLFKDQVLKNQLLKIHGQILIKN